MPSFVITHPVHTLYATVQGVDTLLDPCRPSPNANARYQVIPDPYIAISLSMIFFVGAKYSSHTKVPTPTDFLGWSRTSRDLS